MTTVPELIRADDLTAALRAQKAEVKKAPGLSAVWLPAQFCFSNGGETLGLIPTRYPGAESSDDSQVCLGRKTVWYEVAKGVFFGSRQRVFSTDQAEYPSSRRPQSRSQVR